jgi:hypothetical protein
VLRGFLQGLTSMTTNLNQQSIIVHTAFYFYHIHSFNIKQVNTRNNTTIPQKGTSFTMVQPPWSTSKNIWHSSLFYYSSSKFIALCALHMDTNEDSVEAENITRSSTNCDLTLSYNAYLSKTDSSPKIAPQL